MFEDNGEPDSDPETSVVDDPVDNAIDLKTSQLDSTPLDSKKNSRKKQRAKLISISKKSKKSSTCT